MTKGQMISFKADEAYLDKLDQVCKTLKVNRSEAIRIALDELIQKYFDEEHKGDLVVMPSGTSKWMDIRFKLVDMEIENLQKTCEHLRVRVERLDGLERRYEELERRYGFEELERRYEENREKE